MQEGTWVRRRTSRLAATFPSPCCPVRSHTCWPCLQTSPRRLAWPWQADPPRVSTTKWPLKRSSCPASPPVPPPSAAGSELSGRDPVGPVRAWHRSLVLAALGVPGWVPNRPGHASACPLGPPLLPFPPRCPHLATSPCPGGWRWAGGEARQLVLPAPLLPRDSPRYRVAGKLAGRKRGFLWLSGGGISALSLQAVSEDPAAAQPRSAGAAPVRPQRGAVWHAAAAAAGSSRPSALVGILGHTRPLRGAGLRAGPRRLSAGQGKCGDGRQPPHTSGAGARPGSGHGHRAGHAPGRGHLLSACNKNTSCCLDYYFSSEFSGLGCMCLAERAFRPRVPGQGRGGVTTGQREGALGCKAACARRLHHGAGLPPAPGPASALGWGLGRAPRPMETLPLPL